MGSGWRTSQIWKLSELSNSIEVPISAARAMRPKSSGASNLARMTVLTTPSMRTEILSAIIHAAPLAMRRPRPDGGDASLIDRALAMRARRRAQCLARVLPGRQSGARIGPRTASI